MKVKTATLKGPALDWAVAKCGGCEAKQIKANGPVHLFRTAGYEPIPYEPSTNWSQAGPIIEREIHNLFKWNQIEPGPELWCGVHNRKTPEGIYALQADGPTPLVAAMRCFVASRMGDEIEIPDELLDDSHLENESGGNETDEDIPRPEAG